jgi:MinD superfamily P-loop ATPase
MTPSEMQTAWLREVEADAERGVIQCRVCRAKGPLDAAVTLWRDGRLVFAVCDGCARCHDVIMSPVERGIEVRARSRTPLVVRRSSPG